jgi:hypothetical protein
VTFDKPLSPNADEPASGTQQATAASTCDITLKQVTHLLEPIVRLLLAQGVTYVQLVESLKAVFVHVALHQASSPIRVTDSTVAVTTGIHRKDVKRLRGTAQHAGNARIEPPQSLASSVFTRWLTAPEYCDRAGKPRPLRRQGNDAPSFEVLVQDVSTDVHPRTILNELTRLDLITINGDMVRLKMNSFVPNVDLAHLLEYLGANLHDHAAAAVHNVLGTGPRFLEQSVFSDSVSSFAIDELANRVREEWGTVVKKMVPDIARHEVKLSTSSENSHQKKQPLCRLRLGMYFYAEHDAPPSTHGT